MSRDQSQRDFVNCENPMFSPVHRGRSLRKASDVGLDQLFIREELAALLVNEKTAVARESMSLFTAWRKSNLSPNYDRLPGRCPFLQLSELKIELSELKNELSELKNELRNCSGLRLGCIQNGGHGVYEMFSSLQGVATFLNSIEPIVFGFFSDLLCMPYGVEHGQAQNLLKSTIQSLIP